MSETGPVPFGGRDRELERVDAWLDDQGAPSRLLVTSPAGRGKSALLVQWICSLQGRDITSGSGWQLAFVPMSVRVGTNAPSIFYQALAQRLSDIAGRDLVPPATDAAAYYADRVRELIHDLAAAGTRVLIVLDGLDEALRGDFDSSIFPRLLSPTFRVVASARWQVGDVDSTGWLGRLNWQTGVRCDAFELEALDDAAIADVLVKMGAPVDVIAKHPDLVRRLADLTEREPLLLRFYAEDLWQIGDDVAHITRADLDSLEPGFGSYFSRWLDQQKKLWSDESQIIDHRSVDAVLAVLAFALGPLEANDLIHLATRIHDAPPAVSAISLLEPLRRFVIGDGSYSKGYVLNHPKISQHLQKQHFHPSIAAKTRRGFVDWGRIILDSMNHGDLPTKQTPPYLLQFLCQHLQEIDADHEAFLALVSDGWRRAWFKFEGGSYRGFSHDVQVALLRLGALSKHAEHERPQVLIHKVRCVLCLSSICSRGTNVPVELLPMAVASEVLTLDQARHLAELREDSDGRTQGLVLLAPHMSESERLDLLDRVCGIGQQEARIRELIKLSEHLPPQHRTAALNYVRAILETVNTEGTVNAIREGLPTLPAEERTAAALIAEARADLISDPFSRALALADIANYLPSEKASSARSRAFAAAMSVSDYRSPINLAQLGFSLPENEPNRTTLFFEACRRADALFRALQSHMSWDRDHQITLAIEARVLALAGLAWHNSSQRAQLFDAAVTSALSMPHPYWRADLLTKLLPHLPDSLRSPISDEAMRQGQALESGNNRCHVFTKLVRFVSKERQTELVILALNSAFMIEDDYGRCLALISIAEHTHGNAHALALSHARSTLKNVAYVFHRADVLRSLACYQNQREREATLEAALGLALQVPQPFRLNSLQMLVSHLTPA